MSFWLTATASVTNAAIQIIIMINKQINKTSDQEQQDQYFEMKI